MLPSHSRILTKVISIASTPLQQRQSISLVLFLQCPHLHQSRFPILIHQQLKCEYAKFLSHSSHYHVFFLSRLKLEWFRKVERKALSSHFPQNNQYLHLNITLTSYQYFFHWIKMKLEKRS